MAKTEKTHKVTAKEETMKMNTKIKLFNQQLDEVDKLIGKQTIEMIPERKKQVVAMKSELEVDRRRYRSYGHSSSRNSVLGAIATFVGVVGLSLLLFYPFAVLTALTPGTMLAGAGIIILSSLVVCSVRPLVRAMRYKRYEKKAVKTQKKCQELLDRAPVLGDKIVRESIPARELALEKKFNLANQEENKDAEKEQVKEDDKYTLRDDQILNPENAALERKMFAQMVKEFESESKGVKTTENTPVKEEVKEDELVLEDNDTYQVAKNDTHNDEQNSSYNKSEVVENNNRVFNNEVTSNDVEEDTASDDDSTIIDADDRNETVGNEIEQEVVDTIDDVTDDNAETNNESEKTEDEIKAEEFVVGNNKDEIVKVIVDPNNSAKTEADNSKYVFSVKYKVYNKQNKGPIKTTISVRESDLDKFVQAIGPKNARLNNKLNTIDTLSQLSKSAKRNGLKLELVIHATKMLEGKNVTFTSIPYTDGDKFLKIINTLRDSMVKIGTKQLEEEAKKREEEFSPYYTK